jgi:hypothetical protein
MAFGLALVMLWATSRLLGERHELGYFSARLHETVGRYPEVTRRGVQAAWLAWGTLFALAISPLDPIASPWDEVALLGLALVVSCHRLVAGRRDGR